MKNNNINISEKKYNKLSEEKKPNTKIIKSSDDFNKNLLKDKITTISDEYSNKEDILDEQESKDILLSLDFRKSTENNLLTNLSNKEEKNEQYLKPKYWKYKDKDNFLELENKYAEIKNSLSKGEIRHLNRTLTEMNLLDINNEADYKIKKLDDLNDIEGKEENLKGNIFKFRKIYKDNNSFYRCVIFSVFENMILTNNIMFFKELLIEINSMFSSENNKSNELFIDDNLKQELESNIKIKFLKNIIYILIISMNKNIKASYEILIKIYLTQEQFDSSIILFFRYFLCFYINENKYKIYSKEEEIEICDLLPQKYKEMHISLQKKFELFYINELLRPKSYDSKILYYLIPYFFDTNLDIIYYYPDSKNEFYQKTYGIKESKDLYTINLFFYKDTFNIYYTQKFYEFHSKTLALFEAKIEPKKAIKDISNINNINIEYNFICEKCNKEYNNENNKENILKLCKECLDEEFRNDIYKLYTYYLQYVNHNNKDYKHQRDRYFYLILQDTEVKQGISLFKAMTETGCLIYKVINEIKKDLCLICINNDTSIKYYYQLPCGCRFCSKTCFNKYLDIMIKKHYEKMCNNSYKGMIFLFEFCICGKKYYYDDMIILYEYLKRKKRLNECQMIIKIVKNRWYWKCVKCDNNFDPFCLNKRLFLEDGKINKDFYGKELKHLICSNCYNNVINQHMTKIKCDYCQSEHFIKEAVKVTYQNKFESCSNF